MMLGFFLSPLYLNFECFSSYDLSSKNHFFTGFYGKQLLILHNWTNFVAQYFKNS